MGHERPFCSAFLVLSGTLCWETTGKPSPLYGECRSPLRSPPSDRPRAEGWLPWFTSKVFDSSRSLKTREASFRLALMVISWSALVTALSEEFVVIRCPTCGNDVVYSPVPSLYFCLEQMLGENITISVECKPWILEDAPAADLLKMTERIEKLAVELRL